MSRLNEVVLVGNRDFYEIGNCSREVKQIEQHTRITTRCIAPYHISVFSGGGAASGFPVRQPDLSVHLNPLVYVVFIALLPLDTPPRQFWRRTRAGLTMDWTMGAAGVNTIATVFVAFVRPPCRHRLRPRQRPRRGRALVGAPGRTKVLHGLPRGADGRPPHAYSFHWRPSRGSTRSIRCCASSSARRYRRASSG